MTSLQTKVCHPYDEVADQYDQLWSTPEAKAEDDLIMRGLGVLDHHSILDIGCGTGLFLDHHPHHSGYLGIDPSLEMLERLHDKHPYGQTVNQTFEEFLPELAKVGMKFDQIISLFGSPSYVQPAALLQARNYLAPAGHMICMFIAPGYDPETHRYISDPPPMFSHDISCYGESHRFGNYIVTRLKA